MPGDDAEKHIHDQDESDCVKELRKLLAENDKLSILQCDDAYLKRFLYSTDFAVEKSFKKMKMFYDALEEHSEWFTVKTPTEKRNIIDQDIRLLTNVHDKQGRPVYIAKIGKMNANTMDLLNDIVPVDDFFMELLLLTDPSSKHGVCAIIDISNFSWNLLKWLTPGNIKICLKRIQTMPLKEYRFHVVNNSKVVHVAVNILWRFLPQHIKDGVQFHFEDWDSLHQYIDKELLPPEFGGEGSDITHYRKFTDQLYEREVEITNNFKIYRQPYLNHIEKNIRNK